MGAPALRAGAPSQRRPAPKGRWPPPKKKVYNGKWYNFLLMKKKLSPPNAALQGLPKASSTPIQPYSSLSSLGTTSMVRVALTSR